MCCKLQTLHLLVQVVSVMNEKSRDTAMILVCERRVGFANASVYKTRVAAKMHASLPKSALEKNPVRYTRGMILC